MQNTNSQLSLVGSGFDFQSRKKTPTWV